MLPHLFDHRDYRSYFTARLQEGSQKWGSLSRIAEAIGCQRSQLSRVLKGSVHLTLEQAFGLAQLWKLNEAETDYFLALVEHGRAGSKEFRERLEGKLVQMRREQENLAKRLQQPALAATEKEIIYYSSWHWAALHILVSVRDIRTPEAIARYLSLPLPQVLHCLDTLVAMSLIRKSGQRYEFSSSSMHLPGESSLNAVNMSTWRERAVNAARLPHREGLHYTVTQTISRVDFERLKAHFLKAIEAYSKIAAPSEPEELICFNLDFFQVGAR